MLTFSPVHDDALAVQLEVAIAAHDLRNRLSIAACEIGQLQSQIRLRACEPSVRDSLASAERLLAQTNTLLEAVLDSACIQIHVPAHTPRTVDIVSLAKRLITEDQSTSRWRNVELVTTVPCLTGSWDAARLTLVLHVLLTNAVQCSPTGSSVLLRITRESGDAVVSVTDRGIGIPAPDLPHVFEPFFRARNVEMHSSGIGLGLSIARLIVEQYAGVLDVQSTEGVGTTFTARLPLVAP